MRRAALVGLALASLAAAATTTATTATVPAGTRIPVRMNTSIGTARALGPDRIAEVTRAGDDYAASVTDTVGEGCARIDAGAVVHGRVTELARGTGVDPVKLQLSADSLDGRSIAAHVVDADPQQLPATDLGKTADGAAFAGILFGGIFFGIPGVMIGYSAAAPAAAAGVYNERRVEAWLPAGSTVQVELDEPLTLPARRASC